MTESAPKESASPDPPSPQVVERAIAAIAPFYDLDMGDLRDDLPLYR